MQTSAPSGTVHHDAAATLEAESLPLAGAGAAARPSPAQLAPGRYLLAQQHGDCRVIPVSREIMRIGRAFSADVRLDDHAVSRRHAILVLRGGSARLLDDRSANGTFVNGRPITETALSDGDVIVAGRTILTFRVVAEEPATSASAP
jgi:pSer/pThr/pTyr-binding forkhead associated (FHA) protein